MIKFVGVGKSLKAAWVNRYHYQRMVTGAFSSILYLKGSEAPSCFRATKLNYDLKLLGLTDIPPFYNSILAV